MLKKERIRRQEGFHPPQPYPREDIHWQGLIGGFEENFRDLEIIPYPN